MSPFSVYGVVNGSSFHFSPRPFSSNVFVEKYFSHRHFGSCIAFSRWLNKSVVNDENVLHFVSFHWYCKCFSNSQSGNRSDRMMRRNVTLQLSVSCERKSSLPKRPNKERYQLLFQTIIRKAVKKPNLKIKKIDEKK